MALNEQYKFDLLLRFQLLDSFQYLLHLILLRFTILSLLDVHSRISLPGSLVHSVAGALLPALAEVFVTYFAKIIESNITWNPLHLF